MLVDEFQDTDPVQWDILRRAFGAGGATLVLIGDPKQAIYAFRGADVYAYLEAARDGRRRSATLEVNWRSDQGLIDAYDALFGGAKLGHEGIVYRRVARRRRQPGAAPARRARARAAAHPGRPPRRAVGRARRRSGYAQQRARRASTSPRDLAADLVALLSSDAEIERRADDGRRSARAVRPGHVAVLVRTNRNAALIRDALDDGRRPRRHQRRRQRVRHRRPRASGCGCSRRSSARRRRPRARAAALTPFLGWSAEQVAAAADEDVGGASTAACTTGRACCACAGVASLTETVTLAEGLPARVLARVDGERRLTDLRHVGQLLHAAATTEQLGDDRADRVAAPADRRGRARTRATRSAAAGSSPTPRPSRC